MRAAFARPAHRPAHRPVTRIAGAVAVAALIAVSIATPAAADSVRDNEWWLSQYHVKKAWDVTQGKGVTVAVIDSGIDASQPDLKGSVSAATDFSGAGANGKEPVGSPESLFHGTGVASVLAGRGHGKDNKSGVVGVAPKAKLLSASVWLGSNMPAGADPQRDQVAKAVRWSVDHGASVINLSLGWNDPTWPVSWDQAFRYAAKHDVVVIACVGNRSQGATQAWSPATIPGVVGVTSLRKDSTISKPESAPGIAVDLAGPGEKIPVSWYRGGYANAQGSSFAAPVVAGTAALIRSAHPDMSAANVINRLYRTAEPVKDHSGRTSKGDPDPLVGYGRVDVGAAVTADIPSVKSNPDGSLKKWVSMHRREDAAPKTPLPAGQHSSGAKADGSAQPTEPVPSATASPHEVHDQARTAGSVQSSAGPIFLVISGSVLVIVLGGGAIMATRARRLNK